MIANHRNAFSQVLEAIGSRSWRGQGHALSGGCGGGLCPPPAALGGCEPPWACGHITCLCLHLRVASPCISSKDTCPWIEGRPGSRTISSGESDLHYTCRDPASESGHVHSFWVDPSLGTTTRPLSCAFLRGHTLQLLLCSAHIWSHRTRQPQHTARARHTAGARYVHHTVWACLARPSPRQLAPGAPWGGRAQEEAVGLQSTAIYQRGLGCCQ